MYLTKKEQKELVVKKSKNGKGIFTQKEFKLEQIVFHFSGKLISCDEDDDTDEKTRSNAIRYDVDWYISPEGRIGDFLNHSCEPNAKVVKKDNKLLIVAIKAIKKGDEVLIDYSTIIASDDIWTMKCTCGSDMCRGVVKQFQKLPKKIKEIYLKTGMVPGHILKN